MMTVAELIEFLKTQDPDMLVVFSIYSEFALLDPELITVGKLCTPRNDGWVHNERPDKPSQEYLIFPGN